MQRRLLLAFLAISLGTVLFVGAGTLSFAFLSARSNAEEALTEQLEDIAAFDIATSRNPRVLENFRRLSTLNDLSVVSISGSGTVEFLQLSDPRRGQNLRRGQNVQVEILPAENPAVEIADLNTDQLEELVMATPLILSDDQVLNNGENLEKEISGLQILELSLVEEPEAIYAVYGSQKVSAIALVSNQAKLWYLLSSVIVLALSALGATLLAQRFARPIIKIEKATMQIAAGDLDARVVAQGPTEIENLGHSVNDMASELQRSKALDRQFLLSISHDLRTPLTVISGYAEALSEGAVEDTDATGDIIYSHSQRLERLVKDLLDLARLDAHQFALHAEDFNLTVLTQRLVAGLLPQAETKRVRLQLGSVVDCRLRKDPDRTSQIITNLIENALKYTNSHVLVSIEKDQEQVVVHVADDGPGIDPKEVEKIFDRFYMSSKNPEAPKTSMGMGLAFARELAIAMGGDITVSSTVGEGTKMSFRLPIAE